MLEEWCWSRESLLWIARHYKTDTSLSPEQIEQILEARKVASGLRTADELVRSLFDFELHRTYGDGRSVQKSGQYKARRSAFYFGRKQAGLPERSAIAFGDRL